MFYNISCGFRNEMKGILLLIFNRLMKCNKTICQILTYTSNKCFFIDKKVAKKFAQKKNIYYLCKRYPEYNLFTLKKLIPIEIECPSL